MRYLLGHLLGLCALGACALTAIAQEPPIPSVDGATLALDDVGVLGEPQVIEADVGTVEGATVTLFYRYGGETAYRELAMEPVGSNGLYRAIVPTEGLETDRLEFYMAGEEPGGDVLLRGSAYEPLVRELDAMRPVDDSISTTASTPPTEADVSGSSRYKYLYYALGILAVGLIADAASSSDDDSAGGDGACSSAGCPLTLVLPDP